MISDCNKKNTIDSIESQVIYKELDRLELFSLVYLLLPLIIFIILWLKLIYAFLVGFLLLLSLFFVKTNSNNVGIKIPRFGLGFSLFFAISWVSLSGLAGDFFLNPDWLVRMSVLRDLTIGSWPVSYGDIDGNHVILRFPMGYYLVPALSGKLFGLAVSRTALWLWSIAGVFLFFILIITSQEFYKNFSSWIAALVISILFSGMDVLGWLIMNPDTPLSYGMHIEWWARFFQYSSQTTLLFWVPNHAIPAWIVTMVIWRHQYNGLSEVPASLLVVGLIFWSPLTAITAIPLLLFCVLKNSSLRLLASKITKAPFLAVLPIAIIYSRFITFGMSENSSSVMNNFISPIDAYHMGIFCLFEWGLIAILIFFIKNCRSWLLLIAVIELFLLPFISFGPGNDIVMRGGIPAITIILLITAKSIADKNSPTILRLGLFFVVAIGSVTPILEIQRAFMSGPRYHDNGMNFIEINGSPWHYVAVINQPGLKEFLETPKPMSDIGSYLFTDE